VLPFTQYHANMPIWRPDAGGTGTPCSPSVSRGPGLPFPVCEAAAATPGGGFGITSASRINLEMRMVNCPPHRITFWLVCLTKAEGRGKMRADRRRLPRPARFALTNNADRTGRVGVRARWARLMQIGRWARHNQ